MLIPIRCFTCGEILADKWQPYIILTNSMKNADEQNIDDDLNIKLLQLTDKMEKSV